MTGPAPRVLHVLDSLGMGGAETWLMALLRHWAARGAAAPKMDFLLTGGRPALFDSEARELGARLYYVRYDARRVAGFAASFRGILRRGGYDAIHDHGDYGSGIHYLLALGRLPAVRVSHIHNPWLHIAANYNINARRRLMSRAGKLLVTRLATHVCGTSAAIMARYGFAPQQHKRPFASVLHCGFDIGRFARDRAPDRAAVLSEFGWPHDSKLVLFAGRLDRALQTGHPQSHKNSWLALNVVRMAAERDPAVRLIMAGDGGEARARLDAVVAGWGMADRLKLVGVRTDMPRLMRAADLLFFPSQQEGLGMAAVEAQAAGTPVLASDAVPREAKVIAALYHTASLSGSLEDWRDRLAEAMRGPRLPLAQVRAAMDESDFSIESSARKLAALYGSARP